MTKRNSIVVAFACALIAVLALSLAACSTTSETVSVEGELNQNIEKDVPEIVEETEGEKPSQPAYVCVPNVTADTVQAATIALEGEGFTVVTVSDWSELYTSGHVCAQSPSGYAAQGSCITLTVSCGASPYVIDNGPQTRDIPDVRGYPVAQALVDLEEHGFDVTSIDGPENGIVACYEVTGTSPFSAILHTCPISGGTYDASTPSSMRDLGNRVDPPIDRSEQPSMDELG